VGGLSKGLINGFALFKRLCARLRRLSALSATIAPGSGSLAMSEHSKRSIEQYYSEYPEHARLSSARGQLEFERTKRIVQRFLPIPPAVVADVGGGTGPYSFWLASLGYETHLIEPSIPLLEACRSRIQANPSQARPLTAEVGDARSLWLGDASCDAILMCGPIYHLTERDGRVRALRESRRVLKPHGYAFVATITRVASFIDALCHGLLGDPAFLSIVEADIGTGQHRNPTDEILYFTDAFFHRRAEIRTEMEDAGFEVVAQLPIEGLGMLAGDFDSLWSDPQKRSSLLDLLARTEGSEEVNGASAHYMSVGMKR
jgi:ubiquinone/menaquinone biosynthesis C-methylase UbiE